MNEFVEITLSHDQSRSLVGGQRSRTGRQDGSETNVMGQLRQCNVAGCSWLRLMHKSRPTMDESTYRNIQRLSVAILES